MWFLMLCGFLGNANYECEPVGEYPEMLPCEVMAQQIRESKGMESYCQWEDVNEEGDQDW